MPATGEREATSTRPEVATGALSSSSTVPASSCRNVASKSPLNRSAIRGRVHQLRSGDREFLDRAVVGEQPGSQPRIGDVEKPVVGRLLEDARAKLAWTVRPPLLTRAPLYGWTAVSLSSASHRVDVEHAVQPSAVEPVGVARRQGLRPERVDAHVGDFVLVPELVELGGRQRGAGVLQLRRQGDRRDAERTGVEGRTSLYDDAEPAGPCLGQLGEPRQRAIVDGDDDPVVTAARQPTCPRRRSARGVRTRPSPGSPGRSPPPTRGSSRGCRRSCPRRSPDRSGARPAARDANVPTPRATPHDSACCPTPATARPVAALAREVSSHASSRHRCHSYRSRVDGISER